MTLFTSSLYKHIMIQKPYHSHNTPAGPPGSVREQPPYHTTERKTKP